MQSKDVQICLQILRLWGQLKVNLEHLAEQHGLTLQQTAVLYRLYNEGSMVMGALAKQLHCDASNITGIVDRLEAQKLIERQPVADDRRAKQLCITAKGRQLIEVIMPRLADNSGLEKLNKDEQHTLLSLLSKIIAE